MKKQRGDKVIAISNLYKSFNSQILKKDNYYFIEKIYEEEDLVSIENIPQHLFKFNNYFKSEIDFRKEKINKLKTLWNQEIK